MLDEADPAAYRAFIDAGRKYGAGVTLAGRVWSQALAHVGGGGPGWVPRRRSWWAGAPGGRNRAVRLAGRRAQRSGRPQARPPHHMLRPPSTRIVWQVMKSLSGDARK